MQQVADWLEKLGLGQYTQRFAENDINFSILSDLTDQDLKEIGVSLGHRRQLLREIANLDKTAAAPSAPSPTAPTFVTPTVKPPAEAAGERRHVTVMFCDLVDSTGIAAKLDAEEWRDLVGAYLDAASAAVIEMGGKVAKKLGDGLMALFGYPLAQENDAERAVRAALAIQRALAELNRKNETSSKPALAARIAIDTGPVVIDAGGEIFGDVPNIAARAQALAEPGAVVVTARVQRQIAGLFVAEERGSHELKGVPEPVALYRIVRASGGGRRAGQRHLTPLVGRGVQWSKLVVNLNNAVGALCDVPTRQLIMSPRYRRVLAATIEEALMVLRAADIRPARLGPLPVSLFPQLLRLPTILLKIFARTQLQIDPEARSSMWQDLDQRRDTEIDFLNCEILRLAEANGVHAPKNRRIVELVREAERAKKGSPRIDADVLWNELARAKSS